MAKKLRRALMAVCLLNILVICGCETAKGAAQGFTKDWKNAEKVDAWMRKNLW